MTLADDRSTNLGGLTLKPLARFRLLRGTAATSQRGRSCRCEPITEVDKRLRCITLPNKCQVLRLAGQASADSEASDDETAAFEAIVRSNERTTVSDNQRNACTLNVMTGPSCFGTARAANEDQHDKGFNLSRPERARS